MTFCEFIKPIPQRKSLMYFLTSAIGFLIVLLLLRLLIKPNEAVFHPIYALIYRITDPILVPSKFVSRDISRGILLTVAALVVLRGAIYVSLQRISLPSGIGISLLSLLQLLFQAYMAIWFVSLLSKRSHGTSFMLLIERAFVPFVKAFRRFGIPSHRFHLFVFFSLWILYSLSSTLIVTSLLPQETFSTDSVVNSFGEGLLLILALFPFPGFFSLVIIIGALLSWVSPDPSNPVVQAVYAMTEPLLSPFRRFMPLLGGLDLSPIIALLCFQVLGQMGRELVLGLMAQI
jgi:YggT family protein